MMSDGHRGKASVCDAINHCISAVPFSSAALQSVTRCNQPLEMCTSVTKVWGHRGSLTLFAVTIHPWMDLTVHLSHVQSLALETGNMRKHIKDKEGSKVLSGLPVELDI